MAKDFKNVVVIYSNESVLPANVIVNRVLRKRMQVAGKAKIAIDSEYLDLVRFPGPKHLARSTASLQQKYADRPVDLVIVGGTGALDFMMANRDSLFPDSPLMYCCIDSERVKSDSALARMPRVQMHFDLAPAVKLASVLQPDAKQLFVISGASKFDLRWKPKAEEHLPPFQKDLRSST